MADPLLDLDTLIVRPTIEIDGTRYEILSIDELSVLDSRRFSLWSRKLHALQVGEEESVELDELIDTMARKVMVGAPDDIIGKLSGVQKAAVVEVFTGLLLRSRMSVAGAIGTAMGSPRIGELFSLGSSVSTVERRGNGWRTRLSRWFGRTTG
jgi:hypothetical protein